MAEKKKAAASKPSKSKALVAGQKTLFDLFSTRKKPESEGKELQPDAGGEPPVAVEDAGADTSNSVQVQDPSFPSPHSIPSEISPIDISQIEQQALPKLPTKAIHPFFAKAGPKTIPPRQNATALEVIEILDDEPVTMSRPEVPSATSPSTHISSSRRVGFQALSLSADGGSHHDPIVLDSSPLKAMPIRPMSLKMAYPLFASRQAQSQARVQRKAIGETLLDAQYPDAETQHVRGPQRSFTSPPLFLGLREPVRRATAAGNVPLKSFLSTPHISNDSTLSSSSSKSLHFPPYITGDDKDRYLKTIPKEHKVFHPAITRLATGFNIHTSAPLASSSSQKPWTERWRPTCAEEVLGNERQALYLRDWLRALALQFEDSVALTTEKDDKVESNGKRKGKAKESGRGLKRPRVVRAVEKRGRKKQRIDSEDEEDDWIVGSDESSEEQLSQGEDDDLRQPRSRLYRRNVDVADAPCSPPPVKPPPVINTFDRHLTNTIILAGPPGSGKTAAIYACVEELNWEIFEVYPGIGKRNGANLDHLVGDVGKNHLVRKTQTRGRGMSDTSVNGDAFSKFLGKSKGNQKETEGGTFGPTENPEIDEVTHVRPPTDFGFIAAPDLQAPIDTPQVPGGVRQSVVVLEEVDILFKEDANFWPAVANFIKDCKRPVICTCNDLSLVPTQDLPLQTILTFDPCPPPVAASYLQSLCCAEGYLVERQSLIQLYESTYELDSIDVPDTPINPMSGAFPVPDLRRAITALQLWCPANSNPPRPAATLRWDQSLDSLEDLMNWDWTMEAPVDRSLEMQERTHAPRRFEAFHAELMSFVDSHLIRSELNIPEAIVLNGHKPSPDDEIGHTILLNPPGVSGMHGGFGVYDRDVLIAETAIRLSRGALEVGKERTPTTSIVKTNVFRPRALFRARVDYQSQMVAVLGYILPLSAPLMPRPAVYLDYAPWIRRLIAIDDLQELAHQDGKSVGRMTRNSRGYARTIAISKEDRDILVATGFGDDCLG